MQVIGPVYKELTKAGAMFEVELCVGILNRRLGVEVRLDITEMYTLPTKIFWAKAIWMGKIGAQKELREILDKDIDWAPY